MASEWDFPTFFPAFVVFALMGKDSREEVWCMEMERRQGSITETTCTMANAVFIGLGLGISPTSRRADTSCLLVRSLRGLC